MERLLRLYRVKCGEYTVTGNVNMNVSHYHIARYAGSAQECRYVIVCISNGTVAESMNRWFSNGLRLDNSSNNCILRLGGVFEVGLYLSPYRVSVLGLYEALLPTLTDFDRSGCLASEGTSKSFLKNCGLTGSSMPVPRIVPRHVEEAVWCRVTDGWKPN
jgi:hypothetical protein